MRFDITRDNELIAANTHFFCHGCLVVVPVDQRSDNPDYCRQCWASLEADRIAAAERSRGKWTGSTYNTGKEKFIIQGRSTLLPQPNCMDLVMVT